MNPSETDAFIASNGNEPADLPHRVDIVIVGAGIVGVSTAYELAIRGATSVLVIDAGPLFRTGGSTSHAPGGVFQNNASETVCKLAQWTVERFRELSSTGEPLYFDSGSLEIATTPERWHDLHRKVGFARAWGLDAELLDPAQTVERIPVLDGSTILGSIAARGDGIVRAVPMTERLATRAADLGVRFVGNVRLTGLQLRGRAIAGVETTSGPVACETVVICTGIWSPTLREITSLDLPLQPCAHSYIRTSPLESLRGLQNVVHPIWRHQDHSMYFSQDHDHYIVGSYRHEPRLVAPEEIPLGPSDAAEVSFDPAEMASGWAEAQRLIPELRQASMDVRVCGIFAFTPDGHSLVGEAGNVSGFWVGAAVWVTHSAGVGRALAQSITSGVCDLDLRELDVNRFAAHQRSRIFVEVRGEQQYREVYDIIHPRQSFTRPRGVRRAPWHSHHVAAGAVFHESRGWERPAWFASNALLPRPVVGTTRDDWASREWSPISAAEHLATRTSAGLFDLSSFQRIELAGPTARDALASLTCSPVDRPVGSARYSLFLNERGGIESDGIVVRLDDDRYLVLLSGASGPRDLAWFQRRTRAWPSLVINDLTSGWTALGLWGPSAPTIVQRLALHDDLGDIGPFRVRHVDLAGVPVMVLSSSYVGEPGFELHVPTDYGAHLWEAVWDAGMSHGLVLAGTLAMDSLRLEVGFRALGTDLKSTFTPVEAGLAFAIDPQRHDYLGAGALASVPGSCRLTCLTIDDPSCVPMGKEPILDGDAIVGHVTSAGFGYTIGCPIAYGYLPAALATAGRRLAIEYFGIRYDAVVVEEPLRLPARAGSVPAPVGARN